MSEPFIGEIRIFGFAFPPRGYALCSGQLLSTAQNTALFAIIGATYGGDGRNTFALPNLQGRIPMGEGTGPGLSTRRLGQRAGTNTVTLTASQIPSHSHGLLAGAAVGLPGSDPSNNSLSTAFNLTPYQTANTAQEMLASASIPESGADQAHTNLQPLLSLNFCIALQGIFPERG